MDQLNNKGKVEGSVKTITKVGFFFFFGFCSFRREILTWAKLASVLVVITVAKKSSKMREKMTPYAGIMVLERWLVLDA